MNIRTTAIEKYNKADDDGLIVDCDKAIELNTVDAEAYNGRA